MMLGQLNMHIQKNKYGPLPDTGYKKKKMKMIKDLNMRAKIIKQKKISISRNYN